MRPALCNLECAGPERTGALSARRVLWGLLASAGISLAFLVAMSLFSHPAGAAELRVGPPTSPIVVSTSTPVVALPHSTPGPALPLGLGALPKAVVPQGVSGVVSRVTQPLARVTRSLPSTLGRVEQVGGRSGGPTVLSPSAATVVHPVSGLLSGTIEPSNPLLSSRPATPAISSAGQHTPSGPRVPAPPSPRAPGVTLTASSFAHGLMVSLKFLALVLLASGLVFALRRRPRLLLDLRSAPPG